MGVAEKLDRLIGTLWRVREDRGRLRMIPGPAPGGLPAADARLGELFRLVIVIEDDAPHREHDLGRLADQLEVILVGLAPRTTIHRIAEELQRVFVADVHVLRFPAVERILGWL